MGRLDETTIDGPVRGVRVHPSPVVRTVAALAAVLVFACVPACSSGSEGPDGASDGGSAPTEGAKRPVDDTLQASDAEGSQAGETTTTMRPPTGSGESVTLAFAGDSSFQGLESALASDPEGVLSGIAPLLSGADLTVVNLEAALGTGGTPAPKQFTFRVPPAAIDALRSAGVDAVSMANNHGLDFGVDLLPESLAIGHERGMPLLGIGRDDADAYAPLVVEVRGQRIGVIAANDVFDNALRRAWTAGPGKPGLASAEEDHQDRLAQEVRDLREQVDTLVVFLHYGVETQTCPDARQRDLAGLLLGAGADIVVGGHAHRVQGAGFLGDKVVAYGLGNFIFRANSPEGAASGVLEVRATGRRIDGFRWRPATIRNGLPTPLTGEAEQAALDTMAQRRACAGLSDSPTTPADPPVDTGGDGTGGDGA